MRSTCAGPACESLNAMRPARTRAMSSAVGARSLSMRRRAVASMSPHRPRSPTLRAADELLDARARVGRGASLVDDVCNGALAAAERYGDHVAEPHARSDRHLECMIRNDRGIPVEEAVAPESPRLVAGNCLTDLIGGKPPRRSAHPLGLGGHVVRHLVLVEVGAAAVALPLHLIPLVGLRDH